MDWHLLLVGVASGTSIHAVMEPDNLMRKLRRLDVVIKTGRVEELPLKGINTRPKAYAVGFAFIGSMSGLAYIAARVLNPSVSVSLKYSITVIILSEIILMMRLDRYHVEIEKMTQAKRK